jgi:hypothetical protein
MWLDHSINIISSAGGDQATAVKTKFEEKSKP